MATRPKEFVAGRDFQYAGRRYTAGDPIVERGVLMRLSRFGDRFVVSKRSAATSEPDSGEATQPPDTTPLKEN